MSRRLGSLFVGRLSKETRTHDLQDLFDTYGRLVRCDLKYGAEMAYAFVDFEERRHAEECIKYENGRDFLGSTIVVEWAKGNPRRNAPRFSRGSGSDQCYRCGGRGHWAKDCRGGGYRRAGGGGGGRYRRSRSRDRGRRRRSYSRSRSRSRSRSNDRRSKRDRHRSYSRSVSRSESKSRSRTPRSRSRSPANKSDSRSPERSPRGSPQTNTNGEQAPE